MTNLDKRYVYEDGLLVTKPTYTTSGNGIKYAVASAEANKNANMLKKIGADANNSKVVSGIINTQSTPTALDVLRNPSNYVGNGTSNNENTTKETITQRPGIFGIATSQKTKDIINSIAEDSHPLSEEEKGQASANIDKLLEETAKYENFDDNKIFIGNHAEFTPKIDLEDVGKDQDKDTSIISSVSKMEQVDSNPDESKESTSSKVEQVEIPSILSNEEYAQMYGETFKKAMDLTNSLLDQIRGGRTQYSDKVDEILAQINERDAFSYNPNADALYLNTLAQLQNKGQMAMRDTIGQASALTGGYGSSYAQSVGNRAYNQYLSEANAMIPEYYEMALNEYNAKGNELKNNLNNYINLDNAEYSKNLDNLKSIASMFGTTGNPYNAESSTENKSAYTTTQTDKLYSEALSTATNESTLKSFIDGHPNLTDDEALNIMDYVEENAPKTFTKVEGGRGPFGANLSKKDDFYKDQWENEYSLADIERIYGKNSEEYKNLDTLAKGKSWTQGE